MVRDSDSRPRPGLFVPDILWEDNHLLIVNKPAGMLTQADASGRPSLLDQLKAHIKIRDRKPGNVFLGLVQRLDKPVSGTIVFAKTSKAASRISAQIRERRMTKCYLAITELGPDRWKDGDSPADGWRTVSHDLRREGERTMVDDGGGAAQPARLRLKTVLESGSLGIHAVQLITGRKHQIRAQLSALTMPILGDRRYGASPLPDSDSILLHSYLVEFIHPTRMTKVKVRCVPSEKFFAVFAEHELSEIRAALDNLDLQPPE